MENFGLKGQHWKKLIKFNNDYGSIQVLDSEEDIHRHGRKTTDYRIEFTLPNDRSINLGTRRANAFILKQLLENFGNYVELKQLSNPMKKYSSMKSTIHMVAPLKMLLKGSGYDIVRESQDNSLRYKIYSTNLDSEVDVNTQEI
jgi:hypothetical protein